ncbi:MAG: MgtC/SapB family protein, partial [Candidatus Omnitrophica bacterium]|nr:MgtC/SapB family protein [Candidatus Omnitrophota bacterium]
AGTIIRSGEAVKGLTTAASLWMVSGIGLAVGCGFYFAAFVSGIFALIVLFALRYLEKILLDKEEASTNSRG